MEKIRNFLVCGTGMMGCEIAQVLAEMEDLEVMVYDIKPIDVQAACRENMRLPRCLQRCWRKKSRDFGQS